MLGIKKYSEWSEESDLIDESEKIRSYTDYLRKSYYRNNLLTEETEQDIFDGVAQLAGSKGLISAEQSEEEINQTLRQLTTPQPKQEGDVRFLLDHYRNDFDSSAAEEKQRAAVLEEYLIAKERSPELAYALQEQVDQVLSDKVAIRNARIAAVDRGDVRMIAVDEEDGQRQLYTGADFSPEAVSSELDGLLSNGALSTIDLYRVREYAKPINGGLSTNAQDNRAREFEYYLAEQTKNDPTLKDSIDEAIGKRRREKELAAMSTGEQVWDATKQVAMAPFIFAAELLNVTQPETDTPAVDPSSLLVNNSSLRKRFSPDEILRYTEDFILRNNAIAYRADQPESGIAVDSRGNPVVHASLVPNKPLFEAAIAAAPLNEEQKQNAEFVRQQMLKGMTKDYVRIITSEDSDSVSSLAQARAAGKPDDEWVEEWVSNKDTTYSGMFERTQQFLSSAGSAIASIPVGVGALFGNEAASKALVAMQKDQSDRREYMRLMGDEVGLGFEIVNTIPQVATDVLLTIGTGAGYAGLKTAVTGSAKALMRQAPKAALSLVDNAAAAAVKSAAAAGGEAGTAAAIRQTAASLAPQLSRTEQLAPLFATSFTRSATGTYGTIYAQLPDSMSHDDKHKQALGYALASGLSTGVITTGMSLLGLGAVEDLATRRLRPATLADEGATGVRPVPLETLNYKQAKFLYEQVRNEGRAVTDKAFQSALSKSISGAYKNYLRKVTGGGLSEGTEEALDQAFNIKLEDAALDRDTPLAEKANQVWNAFVIGGALGGGIPAVTQVTGKLSEAEQRVALDARFSVMGRVATELRRTGSPMTAEAVQRQINDANAAAAEEQRQAAARAAAEATPEEQAAAQAAAAAAQAKPDIEAASEDRPYITEGEQFRFAFAEDVSLPPERIYLRDLIGDTVTASGHTGTLELTPDNRVRLAFSKPLPTGETGIIVGERFTDANSVVSRMPTFSVLGKETNGVPAGSLYLTRGNQKYALPPVEGVDQIEVIRYPDTQEVSMLVVKNARSLVGQPDKNIKIASPSLIRKAASFYDLDFTAPSVEAPAGRLDFPLFQQTEFAFPETAPVPVAPTEQQLELPLTERVAPVKSSAAIAQPEVNQLLDNEFANALVSLYEQIGATKESLKGATQNVEPQAFAELEQQINTAESFAERLPEEQNNVRNVILDTTESLSALYDLALTAKLMPEAAIAPAPAPTPEPEPEAPAVLAAPAPKTSKPRKVTPAEVQPIEAVSFESMSLEQKRASLLDDADRIQALQVQVTEAESQIAAARAAGVTVPSEVLSAVADFRRNFEETSAVRNELLKQVDRQILDEVNKGFLEQWESVGRKDVPMKERLKPTPEGSDALQELLDMIGEPETAAEPKAKKKQQKVFEAPAPKAYRQTTPAPKISELPELVFRNDTEADLFNSWVTEGYLIADLVANGFDPRAVNGVSLGGVKKTQTESYQVSVKRHLLAAVLEKYPTIPIPDGTLALTSKVKFSNMTTAGREYIQVPVITDPDGRPTQGIFTNDPRVTMAQLDLGLKVYAPKEMISDDSNRNPSIELHPSGNGEVIGVYRFPNDTGVFGAGDASTVGTSEYSPSSYTRYASINAALRTPAPQFLEGAGPSPTNRAKGTFETYINDANKAGNLYEVAQSFDEEGGTSRLTYTPTRIGKILLQEQNLTEDNADMSALAGRITYSLDLKLFGLASRIQSNRDKPSGKRSEASIILQEMVNPETGGKMTATAAANQIKKSLGISGSTNSEILQNFADYLYEQKSTGRYAKGVPSLLAVTREYGKNAIKAQRNRGELERAARTFVISERESDETPPFQILANSIAGNDDVRARAMAAEEDNFDQLINTLETDDVAYDSLYTIVRDSGMPDLPADITSEDLISLADRMLASQSADQKKQIRDGLQKTESGRQLAQRLIRAGWLPPTSARSRAVPPSRTAAELTPEQRTELARIAELEAEQLTDDVLIRLKRMAKTIGDIKLSRSADTDLAADTARKVNQAQVDRLGLVSGSPESVVEALRRIQDTGTVRERRLAGMLLEFEDVIRANRFILADFNDNRFAGAHSRKSNFVVINLSGHNGRGLADVLIHEYLHAVSHEVIVNPRNAAQREAVTRLTNIMKLTGVRIGQLDLDPDSLFNDIFQNQDAAEFLVEALTNPKLSALVKAATPPRQKSLLRRIAEVIGDLLRSVTGQPKQTKDVDAIEELIDFVNMAGSDMTFRLNYGKTIRENRPAREQSFNELRSVLSSAIGGQTSIAFAPTSQLDIEYLRLAQDPEANRERLQQLVDQAAKAAGYRTQLLYHGSPSKNITEFFTNSGYEFGPAIYLTPEKRRAESYSRGGRVYSLYAKWDNPVLGSFKSPQEYRSNELFEYLEGVTNDEKNATARRLGYDSVVKFWSFNGDGNPVEIAVFNADQVKFADPVTYDADGNIIPLSQRFNPESNDIRFAAKRKPKRPVKGKYVEEDEDEARLQQQAQAKLSLKTVEEELDAQFEDFLEAEEGGKEQEVEVATTSGWLSPNGNFTPALTGATAGADADFHAGVMRGILAERHEAAVESMIDRDQASLGEDVRTIQQLPNTVVYDYAYELGYLRIFRDADGITAESTKGFNFKQKGLLVKAGRDQKLSVTYDNPARLAFIGQRLWYDSETDTVMSPELEEFTDEGVAIDTVEEMRMLLPEGMVLVEDENLGGEAAFDRTAPDRIFVKTSAVNRRLSGLSAREARVVVRSIVNHELGHKAADEAFADDDYRRVALELYKTGRLVDFGLQYYSTSGLTPEETAKKFEEDFLKGDIDELVIAQEWVRAQVTKAAYGTSSESDWQYISKNPTLLDSIVRALKAFIRRISQRFIDYPSTETAASISRASRILRDYEKVGVSVMQSTPEFGDSASFLASLDGTPEGDKTLYSLPILSSNPTKVESFMKKVEGKLYNLPSELRSILNQRTGTINALAAITKDTIRSFPKLSEQAIAAGITTDELQTLFGTTAAPIKRSDLADINAKLEAFEKTLDPKLSQKDRQDQLDQKEEALKAAVRNRFKESFREYQRSVEDKVRRAGFGELVDRAVAVRRDMNIHKTAIGFDESNDIYLTGAYRFFNTTGWSLAARTGGQITINGQTVDFDKLRRAAANLYFDQADAEFKASGKSYTDADVDRRTLELLDNYLETLETAGSTVDRAVVDSIRKDLNRYKPKQDVDTALRALLGEVTDPLANAVNTLYRVGLLSANQKFREDFAATALDLGLASATPQSNMVELYPKSAEATVGSLAGLYVDKDVAAAINEVFGAKFAGDMSRSTKLIDKLGLTLSRLSGAAVQSSTRFGIGYWPRNSIGGFVLSAAQGILFNPFSKAGRESFIAAARGGFSRLPTEEAQRNKILRLIELNVLNDQSQGRAFQDMVRGLVATPEQELLELIADLEEARATKDAGGVLARIKQKGKLKGISDVLGKTYRNATDGLSALDAAIDGLYKANAFFYELDYLDRHHGNSLTVEQKEQEAALKVKLAFPGNSQVIDVVNSFNKSPLALAVFPFARWKTEVFRTMANTVPLALQEIGQGGAMTRRGVQRLVGFTATLAAGNAIVGTVTSLAFRLLTGSADDEDPNKKNRLLTPEEKAALREALPSWQKGHSLLAQLINGKIQYTDLTYVMPYSQLTDIPTMVVEGIRSGEGIPASRIATYVASEWIGAQIAANSLNEVIANENQYGQKIYLETDSAPAKALKMATHFSQTLIPSVAKKVSQISRTGEQNRIDLIAGEILGVRPRNLQTGEIERRGFRNLKAVQDDVVNLLGEASSGRYMDQDGFNDLLDTHQDGMNQVQQRLSKFMRSMISMGSTPEDIVSSAKAYRFSEDTITSAYAGYRIPWVPNDKWVEKMVSNAIRVGEQDPAEKLEFLRRSLDRKADLYWINDRVSD